MRSGRWSLLPKQSLLRGSRGVQSDAVVVTAGLQHSGSKHPITGAELCNSLGSDLQDFGAPASDILVNRGKPDLRPLSALLIDALPDGSAGFESG